MSNSENHIAIISMVCRLPGANDVNTYWKNLCEGVESISFFSEQEAQASGVDAETLKNPNYVRAAGVIDKIEEFDPALFNFSPREATLTDPQHRLLLECGWEALENAGYNPRTYDGMIGSFAGSGPSNYLLNNVIPSKYWQDPDARYEIIFENFFGYLSQKLSYKLHLQGPSVTVQSSCSTSMVATHLACQSLLNYECDMALAGAASIHLPQHVGYIYQPESIRSPDGHCRAFDSNAAGTVFSNGAGMVLLKRLQDAIDDGDCIDAVILGSAVNNDGGRKHGFTEPCAQGQAEVIAMAQGLAEIKPEEVRFIETHGTGTLLGDPIELTGLKKVFNIDKSNHCALGSVKSNIGHTDAVAGIAGLIKTAMAVKNGVIPPSINYEKPNPALGLESSPFYINSTCMNWPEEQGSRIAGVCSYGMGGTNAHAIIQQPPELKPRKEMNGPSLVVLSAANEKSLQRAETNLENFLQNSSKDNVKDIAYTLQVGRVSLAHRRAIVCQDRDDLLAKLRGDVTHDSVTGSTKNSDNSVAFMFTGQGSQYANMGRDLYEQVEVFRTVFDQCADLLQPHLGQDIRTLLYVTPDNEKEAAKTLGQTKITQPLLFAFEYSLAKMWEAWGIEPASFIGHSIGEYVAACLSDVMSLEDALLLVTERGRLIQSLPGGTMMAVSLTEEKVARWLNDDISLAAINAPESCVLSGETPVMDKLANELEKQGIGYGKLHTSHAFHSLMMDPILDSYRERVKGVQLSKPSKPFISNVTGKWITDEEATNPDYWVRHIRQAVRFSDGIQCLADTHKGILLEVGPGNTLCTLSRKHNQTKDLKILASVRHPHEQAGDDTFIYRTLSALWASGCEVKWKALPDAEDCRRVHLPTYPFDKKRYWVDPSPPQEIVQPQQAAGKIDDIDKWFYQPSWQRFPLAQSRAWEPGLQKTWVIVAHPGRVTETLKTELTANGDKVITVLAGTEYRQDGDQFTIDPSQKEHFDSLLAKVCSEPSQFQFIHALSLTAPTNQSNEEALRDNCFSVLSLAQAIYLQEDENGAEKRVGLNVLTQGGEDVLGTESIDPNAALAAGVARANGQEYPDCFTRHIDFSIEEISQEGIGWAKTLADDLRSNIDARSIAYRNLQRWQLGFQSLDLSGSAPTTLRQQGVYIITGGLGNIGLTMAEFLAEKVNARLILLSRSKLPARDEWDAIIGQSKDVVLVRRLQMVRKIEQTGGAVHIASADVTSTEDMTKLVEFAKTEFGGLNGVIHAAGVVGEAIFKPISVITPEDFEFQCAAKVKGTQILKQVLKNTDLDFCMLVSSLSVQLGGLGSTLYSSANRFLDAFSQNMQREGHPWFSIDWDTWDYEGQLSSDYNYGALATFNFTPDEGKQILDKLFSVTQLPPLLCVSTGDLTARYNKSVLRIKETPQKAKTSPAPVTEQQSEHIESNGSARSDSPRNETERILVEIWKALLGAEDIGINDNFFELGGDSLIGLRLTSRIRKQLNVELSINELFQAPTILELAPSLSKNETTPQNGSVSASQLQNKIDQMSPEEIRAMLEKKQQERNS